MSVTALTQESWREPDKMFRASFGIWVFLATEVLFFGALFTGYAWLRVQNVQAFDEAGKEAAFWYGTINTLFLMSSSLAIAIAVEADSRADRAAVRWGLFITILLGLAFIGVKALEYHKDLVEHLWPGPGFSGRIRAPAGQAFWAFYWVMTGLHALHVTAGLGIVGRTWLLSRRDERPENFHRTIEVSALYWHLIDVIWVLLYPIFYLVGRAA